MQILIILILLLVTINIIFIALYFKKRYFTGSSKMTNDNTDLLLFGNLFWNVFNTSNSPILILQDFKIVNCNKMALKIFKGDQDDLIGKTPFDLSPEKQLDESSSEVKIKEIYERIFSEGNANFEWWHKNISGELFLAKVSVTSFQTNGKFYASVTMQDITKSKEEETELYNYRLKLEQLVEEKTKSIEDSNQELQSINEELDASNEELYAANEELNITNTFLQKEIAEHKKTQEDREKYRIQLEALLKEKTERLEQLSVRFNEIYTNSSDAITFMDIQDEGNIIKVFDMNPVSKRLFNITDKQLIDDIYINDLLPRIKIESFKLNILPKLLSGISVTFTDDRDNGNGYWRSTIYPVKNETGKVYRIAAFSRNVTAEYEQEKTSAILHSAIESWPYEFWVCDNEGTSLIQNKASQDIWGNLIGKKLNDLPEQLKQNVADNVAKVLNGEASSSEYSFETNKGKRYVLYNLNPIEFKNVFTGFLGISVDITQQKIAEIALEESKKRLNFLLSSVTDYKFTVEIANGKVISTVHSEGCLPITGYSPVDFQNNPNLWYEMIHNDDKPLLKEWSEKTETGIEIEPFEHRIIRKNGETIWVSNTTVLKRDSDGTLLGFDGLISNITKRKNAELALKESENRFRQITRLTKHLVYDYNLQNGIIQWDGAIEEVTGYTSDEYKNTDFKRWSEMIHPDDKDEALAQFEESLTKHKPYRAQYRFKNKTGNYIRVEEDSHLIVAPDNTPIKYLGVMKDVTEQIRIQSLLKESEEKLRTIFNTSNDGIVVADKKMNILDINPSALSRSGYLYEDVSGKSIFGFLLKENIPIMSQYINLIWNGKTIKNFETEILIKNDGSFPVEISASAMHLNKKDVLLLLIRDITERKQHEKELLQSVINTEEKERIHFSQELHDGIGPLLSAAKMYVEWLAEPEPSVDPNIIIPDIQKLLEESDQTVKDISFKLSPHILQNYGIVEALNAFSEKIEKSSKINIIVNAVAVNRFDEIIETIIYRVICECINNSLKHANASNIIVSLKIADNILIINFSDDGMGFDVDTTSEKYKGIGLLNIQSRLKSINGQFFLQSAKDKGTKISIKVPLYT